MPYSFDVAESARLPWGSPQISKRRLLEGCMRVGAVQPWTWLAVAVFAVSLFARGQGVSSATSRPPLPGGDYQPFAADSPFNIPIPANPKLDPKSEKIIATLTGMTHHELGALRTAATPTRIDYTFPFYYSIPSDPAYTISCHFNGPPPNWGDCPLEKMTINIPAYARPENSGHGKFPWSTDHHLAVIDAATGTEYDLWGAAQPNGKGGPLTIGWGALGPITSQGINIFGATASQFALTIGVVRSADINAGVIPHALQMAVPCANGMGVYPAAVNTDEACPKSAAAPPYYGMRVQLNLSDDEINALDAPAYAKTVFLALAHYGAFVSDTGTGDSMEFQTESGLTYTMLGLPDPWVALAQQYGIQPDTPLSNPYSANLFPLTANGVNVTKYLRVIAPCVTAGTC